VLEKDSLALDEPINKLGVYNLKVNVYSGVEATFTCLGCEKINIP